MALHDIIAKIDSETEAKIKATHKELEARLQSVADEHAQKRADCKKNFDERRRREVQDIDAKAKTAVRIESKNILLREKRVLIQDVFAKAITALCEASQYGTLITRLMEKQLNDFPKGEIMPAKGKHGVTESAVRAANLPYEVSDKEGDFAGGFVLKTPMVEIDATFESILQKQLCDELEPEIIALLFGNQ